MLNAFTQLLSVRDVQLRQRYPSLFHAYDRLVPNVRLRRAVRTVYDLFTQTGRMLLGDVTCRTTLHGTPITFIDRGQYDYYDKLRQGRAHEPALTRRLAELFNGLESPTFVDVGAHFGYFTVYAGKALAGRGRVVAVEPNAGFHAHLQRNVAVNGLTGKVSTYQIAFSSQGGHGRMTGWDHRVLAEESEGAVEVVTFDDFCVRQAIRPDIVKIDVHGGEGRILAGMPRMLLHGVSHLFCELHRDMLGYTATDLVAMLQAAGLEVAEFTRHREDDGGQVVPISTALLENPSDHVLYARRPGSPA